MYILYITRISLYIYVCLFGSCSLILCLILYEPLDLLYNVFCVNFFFLNEFQLFYDLDILEEKVLLDWSEKISKKYVSKELSQEIHNRAKPFISWLKEAEEESESESEDDVEVRSL